MRLLMPIPEYDFDTTEVAIPWERFKSEGYQVTFSTPSGRRGFTDPLLLTGVLFGQLGASQEAIQAYRKLEQSEEFQSPIPYGDIDSTQYDCFVLPGGHAKGMKPYLESQILQQRMLDFWKLDKPVGAICHGTIVLARTIDPQTGQSIIFGKKLTGLTKTLEKTAYYLTAWRHGKYYRTYPEYVQDEVTRNLRVPTDFIAGGRIRTPHVVKDGNLITARCPVDAAEFADQLVKLINKRLNPSH
ncbi:thiamine biosynthesis protein ThiJ [Paenibacillus sp. SYP-B3998]|uniref:Thiamine biosynthesis protein ThiJ n=1 Tax=Paenibacillus sp. SYP-B3998 TaxID=2678564 RepID=A0A6G4A4M2_9BACL|nr:thiamine biosynthesis protein ThiJ [Paenibacillus sp. SYP-B3998]